MEKDLYKILEVEKEASQDEIKKSYRRLSMKYHPDHNPDDKESEEKFKEINVAYSTLSDPQKREQYDNPMSGFDPFSFFNGFGSFNRDPFFGATRMRRQNRPDPNAPRKGGLIEIEVPIPFNKLILREEITLNVNFIDVCVSCKGSGASESEFCDNCKGSGSIMEIKSGQGIFIQSSTTCPQCRGRGNITIQQCEECDGRGNIEVRDKEIKFQIDESMRDRSVIKIHGAGGKGLNGGPDGDVVAVLSVKFPRKEDLTEEQINILKEIQ